MIFDKGAKEIQENELSKNGAGIIRHRHGKKLTSIYIQKLLETITDPNVKAKTTKLTEISRRAL